MRVPNLVTFLLVITDGDRAFASGSRSGEKIMMSRLVPEIFPVRMGHREQRVR